jgi:hypothetical protein
MTARYATKDTVFNCPTWHHIEVKPEPVRRPPPLAARVIIRTLKALEVGCLVLGALLAIVFVAVCVTELRRRS